MAGLGAFFGNRWVRYGLTFLLVGLVIRKVDPHRLMSTIGSARPEYLVLAAALTFPFLYLKALRWYVMLRTAGVRTTFGEATLSLIGGMGLALLTPARLGEVIRAAFLRDGQKMKIGGLVLIDKAFDVLVLTGLSVAGVTRFFGVWMGALFLCASAAGLVVVFYPQQLSRGLHALSARTPAQATLDKAWTSLASLSPRSTVMYIGLTVLAFVVILVQFAVILLSWKSWSLDIVVLTFPLVILTNVVPLTVAGLGVREGVATILLAHYGVPAPDAVATAFISFTINTALPGICGAALTPSAVARAQTRALEPANRP